MSNRPRPRSLALTLLGAINALGFTACTAIAQVLPDAPEPRDRPPVAFDAPRRYADALASWRTPEDIARFADATFVYDRRRALALAEAIGALAARAAGQTARTELRGGGEDCIYRR